MPWVTSLLGGWNLEKQYGQLFINALPKYPVEVP